MFVTDLLRLSGAEGLLGESTTEFIHTLLYEVPAREALPEGLIALTLLCVAEDLL